MPDATPLAILSIQSGVAYGHVGNTAAVFPLQRLGCEVWPVNTVQFSNHTGYGAWRGEVFRPAMIAEIIAGVAERGVLGRCDAVLSGYVGDAALGGVILDAVAQVRAANPDMLYCCDPVMGDVGRGFFVRPGIPAFFRDRAIAAADIVTPNQFELEYLTGRAIATLPDALAACRAVQALGPGVVLLTSLRRSDAPSRSIEMLAVGAGDDCWLIATPLLPLEVDGAGDVVAALFLAHYLRRRQVRSALEEAAAAIFAVLEVTHAAGARELQLVAAQHRLAAPERRFTAIQVG